MTNGDLSQAIQACDRNYKPKLC